jgi:branched-chain amino acid transport system substrate-binding protein
MSKIRAANPEAVYTFYPGAAAVQFLNQYAQAGLQGKIPLYSTFMVDSLTLPRQKDSAVGSISVLEWGADLPNEANKKFVAAFTEKFKNEPSFYAAQTYDAGNLLVSAVEAVKGDVGNKEAVQAALKKADFKSVRGGFKFGNNNFPIQNFYVQEVVKDGENYRLKTIATAVENGQDIHHDKCPLK